MNYYYNQKGADLGATVSAITHAEYSLRVWGHSNTSTPRSSVASHLVCLHSNAVQRARVQAAAVHCTSQ